jgi:aminoglycoside/choline kinase family phosphotransferase
LRRAASFGNRVAVSAELFHAEADLLAKSAWGSRAAARETRPLAGDASSRRYFRVELDRAPAQTAVLMVQTGSGLSISSDELSSVGAMPEEMPFLNVQRYLRDRGVAVPEVYAADSPRGVALLEDLGDTTLWDAAGTAPEAAPLYRAAIDELVALQRAGAERPDPDCVAFRQRFDAQLFLWEFDHFLEHGLSGRSVSAEDRATLRRRFGEIAEELAAGPLALTHRDYHSWNLFVCDERIRVIDFQDALLAPVPYDLATLLNDRATPTLVDSVLERTLVGHFCTKRREALGDTLGVDAFLARYFLFVLQKSFKIVGRFHYLEEVKGKQGYLAMLPHTFATLRRCFDNLPALGDMRAVLARAFAELR